MFDIPEPEKEDFSKQWEICIHSWIRQAIDGLLKDKSNSDLRTMAQKLDSIRKCSMNSVLFQQTIYPYPIPSSLQT